MPRRHELRKVLALAALTVVLAPGCFRPPGSGVSVKSLAADLVFGVPPLPEEIPPANFDLTPEDAPGVVTTGPRRAPARTGGSGTGVPSSACPEAAPTDFPDQEATTDVQVRPKEGTYQWIVDGRQEVPAVGTQTLPRQVQRNVFDVKDVGGGVFEFKTREKELIFGSSVLTTMNWRVRNQPAPNEPAGIYLLGWTRKSRSEERVFSAFLPIQMLPIPVRLGATIQTVTFSGDEGETLEHRGTVSKRERVDACGKVIDSWFVDAEQTFTSSGRDSYTRNFDYGLATQFGGIQVLENVDIPPPPSPPQLTYKARIGQVEPDALREIF